MDKIESNQISSERALVIIPTYNERENIEDIIRAVFSLPEEIHILIVDDNSPDGTAVIVKNLMEEFHGRLHLLHREKKEGLGAAYLSGFHWALEREYAYIMEMDADFSHNPEDLPRLLSACREENVDMSVGSRYIKGINVVHWDLKRILLSYFASKYVRLITGIPVYDTTAGFVCYKRKVLQTIDFSHIHLTGYAFQIEMKYKVWKHGYKIKEIPIIFTDRTRGESKMNGSIIGEAVLGVIQMRLRGLPKKNN